ncbi:MAG: CinA family protein [Proteobacteria bacterium]|nr:CinA family protein [Pseudomonadota bacterium]
MFAIDQQSFEEPLHLLQSTCTAQGLYVATAESCTGGLLSALLTHRPGSSSFFLGGVAAYANSIKSSVLGVPERQLQEFGAVSLEVARSMAEGVSRLFGAQLSCAITGIAGPGGDTSGKPVGFVCFAWNSPQGLLSHSMNFSGTREDIRAQSCRHALDTLLLLAQNTFQKEQP